MRNQHIYTNYRAGDRKTFKATNVYVSESN